MNELTEYQDQLLSYIMMEEIACIGREEALKLEEEIKAQIVAEFDTDEKAFAELDRLLSW